MDEGPGTALGALGWFKSPVNAPDAFAKPGLHVLQSLTCDSSSDCLEHLTLHILCVDGAVWTDAPREASS